MTMTKSLHHLSLSSKSWSRTIMPSPAFSTFPFSLPISAVCIFPDASSPAAPRCVTCNQNTKLLSPGCLTTSLQTIPPSLSRVGEEWLFTLKGSFFLPSTLVFLAKSLYLLPLKISVLQFSSANKSVRDTVARALAQQGEAEKTKLAQHGEELVLRSSSMPVFRLLRVWNTVVYSDMCWNDETMGIRWNKRSSHQVLGETLVPMRRVKWVGQSVCTVSIHRCFDYLSG